MELIDFNICIFYVDENEGIISIVCGIIVSGKVMYIVCLVCKSHNQKGNYVYDMIQVFSLYKIVIHNF